MKRNNKIVRARMNATTKRREDILKLQDGTEVLRTKESKRKPRRWSFIADMEIEVPAGKDDAGNDLPPLKSQRTVKLDAVSYGSVTEAREDLKVQEQYLRSLNPTFARAKIQVLAIPHETVSNTTMNQLSGYRDMSMILDKALGIAIEEAEQVVLGKSLGSQFVQSEALPETEGTPAKPAATLDSIKNSFYEKAKDRLRTESEPLVVPANQETPKSEIIIAA